MKMYLMAGALWLMATLAIAQEYQPYPSPKITPEQWGIYAEQVRQLHGKSLEVFEDKQLFAFSDRGTRTFWIFTLKRHPAHPAWITRQMYEEGDVVRIRQIGYFAGSEEEFAKLFREYQERNEQLKEEVWRQNQ
ncbi:MAG: hypothetical protein OEW16_00595 [Gammaproteobacteria bacterium]|nr:hypothetical protein [Betaproteobacteria bacterium]MDH4258777.1 hypothetical protein [Gammaproteobacteria bacterium]